MGLHVGTAAQYFHEGEVLVNGFIYVYDAGTSTNKAVFTDPDMLVPGPNPLRTDENGEVEVYWSGLARVVVTTELGGPVSVTEGVSTIGQTGGVNPGGLAQYWATWNDSPAGTPPPTPTGDGNGNGWSRTPVNTPNWRSEKNEILVTDGTWSPAIFLPGTQGLAGVAGTSPIVGRLTNEVHTYAADANGVVADYSTGNGFFNVFQGTTNVNASATYSIVNPNNVSMSINTAGAYLITGMIADEASATLRATVFGVQIDVVLSLSKSRSGVAGDNGANASLLRLVATSQTFLFDNSTGTPVAEPPGQSIAFNIIRQNLTAVAAWTTSPVVPLNITGDTATLSIADFGNNAAVQVTATAGAFFDQITINRLQSGQDGSPGAKNFADPSGWTESAGDQVSTYATFEAFGANNNVQQGVDGFGRPIKLWVGTNSATTFDGGWQNAIFDEIDHTKNYISFVYFRRESAQSTGVVYHGCGISGLTTTMGGVFEGNPYFMDARPSASFGQGETYVSVGYMFGSTHPQNVDQGIGKTYKLSTGEEVFTNIDYKIAAGAQQQSHRALMFGATDATQFNWWGSGFYEINGSEPSLAQILEGFGVLRGYLTNESHTFSSDAAGLVADYTTANGNFVLFDGATNVTALATFTVDFETGIDVSIAADGSYVVNSMSADQAIAQFRATYNGRFWIEIFSAAKSRSAQVVRLSASSQQFHFNSAGALDPAGQEITFTATRSNIAANASFSSIPSVPLSGSGDVRTLTGANFGSNTEVQVIVTAGSFTDAITVIRTTDGAEGPAGQDGQDGQDAVLPAGTPLSLPVSGPDTGVSLAITAPDQIKIETTGSIDYTLLNGFSSTFPQITAILQRRPSGGTFTTIAQTSLALNQTLGGAGDQFFTFPGAIFNITEQPGTGTFEYRLVGTTAATDPDLVITASGRVILTPLKG